MRRFFAILITAIMGISSVSFAEETDTLSIDTDTIAIVPDTIPFEDFSIEADTLPWEIREFAESMMDNTQYAPIRKAGATTHLDSVVYTNQNGAVTKILRYDYDESERQYRTTTEYFDPATGAHNTTSTISEYGYDGNTRTTMASYKWANNQWEGITRNEKVYKVINSSSKQITDVTYSWNPSYSFWTPTQTITYQFDNSLRVPEQWTWKIDATTKNLKPAERIQQDWDAKNNLILKITYKGGTTNGAADGTWIGGSGGNKHLYEYRTFGTANKKVNDEEYPSWNTTRNDWAGQNSKKTTWDYNANGSKETENITYNWDATAWQYVPNKATYTHYNDANYETEKTVCNWNTAAARYDTASATFTEYYTGSKVLSKYSYVWTNGVKTGTGNGVRNVYSSTGNVDSAYTYTWKNGEWVATKIVVSIKNAQGKAIIAGTLTYNTSTNHWSSSGNFTYTYYAANGTTQLGVTHTKLTNDVWTPVDSTAYIYVGSKKEQDQTYTWSVDHWVNNTRKDYFTGGAVSLKWTNGEWVIQTSSSTKIIQYTYPDGSNASVTYRCSTDSVWFIYTATRSHNNFQDAQGATVSLSWNMAQAPDSVWTLQSGTRTPVTVYENGKSVLQRSYYCGPDSIWKVKTYTVWQYDDKGRQIYTASFKQDSVPESYSTASYNDVDEPLEMIQMNYNASSGTWTGHHKYVYEYLPDGHTKSSNAFYTSWSTACGGWQGSTKTDWTYYANGRIETTTEYNWSSCNWAPMMKHYYEYDAAGNIVVQIDQNPAGSGWVNYRKTEKEYSGSTEIKNNVFVWSDGGWQELTTQETTYVGNTDNVSTELNITYNTDGTIATYELATYHYNTD